MRIRQLRIPILIALALAAAVITMLSPSRPRFPGEGSLEVDLPALRVPSADCYEDESDRVLLLVEDSDRLEFRFSWDPADGAGRVREVDRDAGILFREPGPIRNWLAWLSGRPSPEAQPPALVVACSLDLVDTPMPPRRWLGATRVYLGGLTRDGNIGAVPFQADPEICEEMTRVSHTIIRDPEGDLTVELRITREGDRVRYRWGPATFFTDRDVGLRFSGGDVSLTAEEVAAGGEGPLLPGLAERLARKRAGDYPIWKIVLLEVGSGVRYVDILRAVECAPGDPLVDFQFYPDPRELESEALPSVPAGGEAVLGEQLDLGRICRYFNVHIDAGENIFFRGREQTLAALGSLFAESTTRDRDECALWVDRVVPWSRVLAALRVVRSAGPEVCFVLPPLDRKLYLHTMFRLPAPQPDEALRPVALTRSGEKLVADREDVAGHPVRVRVPEDARFEETLHALIRLRLAGATAFAFE